jgi:protein SCO1
MLTTPARPTSPAPPDHPRGSARRWPVRRLGALLAAVAGVLLLLLLTRPAESPWYGGVIMPPRALPPLTLTRATGGDFTTDDLRGRVSLVFFGYTSCPDVCPLALAHAVQVKRLLGARAEGLAIVFVTVDPGRDTPERLARYTGAFDPAIVGLTGSDAALAAARTAFGAVAERRETPGSAGGYAMDHSATISIVDRQGRLRLVFPPRPEPAEVAADLARLLAE